MALLSPNERPLAMTNNTTTPKMLKIDDVIDRVALSRSTIYDMERIGAFPKKYKIGKRAVSWLESEVSDWILQRSQQRGA